MIDATYALYWLAAARSGFAKPADWKAWADKRIDETDAPASWIIDLSLADNAESLAEALALRTEVERHLLSDPYIKDVVLGYVWLRYERGEMNLEEVLAAAGRLADNFETDIECEFFYARLNRLEHVPAVNEERRRIEQEVESRLRELREEASRQWHLLNPNGNPNGDAASF